MHLSLATSYDASPEEVFAMITDITFQEQVFEQLQTQSYGVEVGDDGDDVAVQVHWLVSEVPVVARRFVGNKLELEQSKRWHRAGLDGAREADVDGGVTGTAGVGGATVKLSGTTRILPVGRGTRQAFDLHITASLPVVRGTLEQLVADAVRARLENKFKVASRWLSGSL
ncbi:DUF2505 domain-containing protein [Kribbella sp.]|uniref:DUF2505 domain-containing protein n=1 Tax=Kribbella sp. TaxID=1871183 RepID=UPI002D396C61|nr:DUF2505 domain-containing protein [Kribbella sp.]HZX06224.1 DUF2505 domain-containing protein [Kribbella sp.]